MTDSTDFVDAFFTDASDLSQPLALRHRVDVLLVTHDGARWLPRTLAALRNSSHSPDAVHVVDTGSIDATLEVLEAARPIVTQVLTAPRDQAYATSLAQAVAALPEVRVAPGSQAEVGAPGTDYDAAWLWILHDDSAPAADALHALLRASERFPDAAILGTKSVGWNDSSRLQEVGITLTGSGHRHPGVERGERDQGQYSASHEVLAVGSAGMLVRRDVWDTLQGMRPIFRFYRDDIDFCWRAWEHGYRVRVVPQAEIAHREAATHGVRAQDVVRGSAHRVGREHSLATAYIHARAWARPFVLVRLVVASLFRALVYFLGKDPRDSGDELRAVFAFLRSPRLIMREIEARGVVPVRAPRRLRPSVWVQLWHGFDLLAGLVVEKVDDLLEVWAGTDAFDVVEVLDDPDDADEAIEDVVVVAKSRRQSFLAHVWRRPGTLLFVGLTTVGILGTRNLWGSGALEGGSLLPVTVGARELFAQYVADWHTVGLGSGAGAPPWLPLLAVLSWPFGGDVSTTVTALLVLGIPLAGLSAHLAARVVIAQAEPRAFFAATYALFPATLVAIGNGRLGTVVLAIVLPGLLRLAWRCDESWRRAAVTAMAVAFTAAWVPSVWLYAVILGLAGGLLWRRERARRLRIALVVAGSWLLLFPVSLEWLQHPELLTREAGASLPAVDGRSYWDVLLLQPAGPTAPWRFALVGLVFAAAAALVQRRRARRVVVGWMTGIIMFGAYVLVSVVSSRLTVIDPTTGTDMVRWAGPFTLALGIVLLVVVAAVTDGLAEMLGARSFGWRHLVAVGLTAGVLVAPVLSAGSWLWNNGQATVTRAEAGAIPAFVAARTSSAAAQRVLVLERDAEGVVRFNVLDGGDEHLGDADVRRDVANEELAAIIGSMLSGRDRTDAQRLADFGITYVVAGDGDALVNGALDGAVGLRRVSGGAAGASSTWAVQAPNARLALVRPQGSTRVVEPLPYRVGSALSASTRLETATANRILVLAEAAGPWRVTLAGRELQPAPNYVTPWRQAWVVPEGAGGRLLVDLEQGQRAGGITFQVIMLIVALVLALPSYRPYADVDAEPVVTS